MRLDNERPSANVEDRRGQGGYGNQGGFGRGFGFPGGGTPRNINIPMGGRGGLSISTIIVLIVIYFAIKLLFGVDLIEVMNGGSVQVPSSNPEITVPRPPIDPNTN
jgi:uncharacterized protein